MYRIDSLVGRCLGVAGLLLWCSACGKSEAALPKDHVSQRAPVGGFTARLAAETDADAGSADEADAFGWEESCSGDVDVWACDYSDNAGTTCHVEGDSDTWLSQYCEGEWGSYACETEDGVFYCSYADAEGAICDEAFDATTFELIESSCDWWGDDDGEDDDGEDDDEEYSEECVETDAGAWACTYDDGEWACEYVVTADGELLSSECTGPDGTYQSCELNEDELLACESFDGLYACEELYDDEGIVEYSCVRVDAEGDDAP